MSVLRALRPPTPAGTIIPTEWKKIEGEARETWQLTAAAQPSYPLYYFVPSHTADGRYLIYHSERSSWVQLYRMDLQTGESLQLTCGTTREAGWEVWSEVRLRGIYDHLSALNQVTNEVYYFDHDDLRSVHIETLEDRRVLSLPGRHSVGQTAFSPNGKLFSFIHSDRRLFKDLTSDLRSMRNMRVPIDQEEWRQAIPSTIAFVDVETGEMRDLIELPYYVHHVIWIDDSTILINHIGSYKIGMWTMNIHTGHTEYLRPLDEDGAVCHQLTAAGTIFYETQKPVDGRNAVALGRYDIANHRYEEFPLVEGEYSHVGGDPAGRFVLFESAQERNLGDRHYIAAVRHGMDPARRRIEVIKDLSPAHGYRLFFQRGHAHPFLDPSRRWLYYTQIIDDIPQICRTDVSDLVDDPSLCWPDQWTAPKTETPAPAL